MTNKEKIDLMIGWLEEKNLTDIQVVDISQVSVDMESFIIATASNDRLSKAASEFLEEKAEENGIMLINKEGKSEGRWILLNFGGIIVHIFLQAERELYNLEKLWTVGDGKKEMDE